MEASRPFLITLPVELQTMICKSLGPEDLFTLTFLCKSIHDTATRVLYEKDAREADSSAILWAAAASSVPSYRESTIVTLNRSITYRGNVNAVYRRADAYTTAIHVAVAHGSEKFVQTLVENGASVVTRSFQLWHFLCVGKYCEKTVSNSTLLKFAEMRRIQNCQWLPLLPAIFRQDLSLVNYLAQAGCLPYLAFRPGDMPPNNILYEGSLRKAYTIHHMVIDQRVFKPQWDTLFHRFPTTIATVEPGWSMSPLMRAIELGNEMAAELLLQFPQDLDIVSSMSWCMISYAVLGASTFFTPKQREWSRKMVSRLLKKGANPNISSPIDMALDVFAENTFQDSKEIRSVITELLHYRADVNAAYLNLPSIGHYFFTKIGRRHCPQSAREVFCELLEKGLRVNDRFPDGSSMLARSLDKNFKRAMMEDLLRYGARLTPQEFDQLFRRWIETKEPIPEAMIQRFGTYVLSEGSLNSAYVKIFRDQDNKKYKNLTEWWGPTTDPSRILPLVLNRKGWHREDIFALPFDPNWCNRKKQSYAHIIINRLCAGEYTEPRAIEDMTVLVRKHLNLRHKDFEGQTALARLEKHQETVGEQQFSKMEFYLLRECRNQELGRTSWG